MNCFIYSGEKLEQLFKVIQGDPSEFGVIMAAFYGLRRSEIVGLKWNAIDFENKKISIQHTVVTAKVNGTLTEIARDKTKTKSSCRTLPLIPACEQMLNNWVTVTPELAQKYEQLFHQPEAFLKLGNRLLVLPVPDEPPAEKPRTKPPAEHDR